MKTISAYQARTNFGELLNLVYYQGDEVVVERKGKPLVKISKFVNEKPGEDSLIAAAGVWKDIDTEKIIAKIYKSRQDGSGKRKFLASW